MDEIAPSNFNYTDNKGNDVNRIIWTDFQKTKTEIIEKCGDKTVIEIIDDIFNSNEMIEFIKNSHHPTSNITYGGVCHVLGGK